MVEATNNSMERLLRGPALDRKAEAEVEADKKGDAARFLDRICSRSCANPWSKRRTTRWSDCCGDRRWTAKRRRRWRPIRKGTQLVFWIGSVHVRVRTHGRSDEQLDVATVAGSGAGPQS